METGRLNQFVKEARDVWSALLRLRQDHEEMVHLLRRVLYREDNILSSQADLDTALSSLTASLEANFAATDALITSIQNTPGVDFSAEIQAVQTAQQQLQAETQSIQAVTPAPSPEPTPAPTPEPTPPSPEPTPTPEPAPPAPDTGT